LNVDLLSLVHELHSARIKTAMRTRCTIYRYSSPFCQTIP